MDLSLVSTDELMTALLDRSDEGIICLRQWRDDTRSHTEAMSRGDELTCIGLCKIAERFILDQLDETECESFE